MAKATYICQPGEAVLLQTERVKPVRELILSNRHLSFVTGTFKKKLVQYPLNEITVFNGIPQAVLRENKGQPTLEVYFSDGQHESFWFPVDTETEFDDEIETLGDQISALESDDNDSVLGVFLEVGEIFLGRTKRKRQKEALLERLVAKQEVLERKAEKVRQNAQKDETLKWVDAISRAVLGDFSPAGSRQARSGSSKRQAAQPLACKSCGAQIIERNGHVARCSYCDAEQAVELNSGMSFDEQIDALKKLKSLLDTGVLSQDEFDAKKKEIMRL